MSFVTHNKQGEKLTFRQSDQSEALWNTNATEIHTKSRNASCSAEEQNCNSGKCTTASSVQPWWSCAHPNTRAHLDRKLHLDEGDLVLDERRVVRELHVRREVRPGKHNNTALTYIHHTHTHTHTHTHARVFCRTACASRKLNSHRHSLVTGLEILEFRLSVLHRHGQLVLYHLKLEENTTAAEPAPVVLNDLSSFGLNNPSQELTECPQHLRGGGCDFASN